MNLDTVCWIVKVQNTINLFLVEGNVFGFVYTKYTLQYRLANLKRQQC